MQQLIKQLESLKMMDQQIKEHSLVIDHNQVTHGCIFFIKIDLKNYKIFVPTGFYEKLILEDKLPKIKELIQHPEAMLLK